MLALAKEPPQDDSELHNVPATI